MQFFHFLFLVLVVVNPLAQCVDGSHRFIVALLPLLQLCTIHRLPRLQRLDFLLLFRQLLLGLRQLLLGLRQLKLQRRVEHDGRRHRLGLHLRGVDLHRRRRQLAGRAVVVVSGNIRNLAQIGPVVRRVDPLNRADVAASAAILVPASALVPAHESGHLVSVGVLA